MAEEIPFCIKFQFGVCLNPDRAANHSIQSDTFTPIWQPCLYGILLWAEQLVGSVCIIINTHTHTHREQPVTSRPRCSAALKHMEVRKPAPRKRVCSDSTGEGGEDLRMIWACFGFWFKAQISAGCMATGKTGHYRSHTGLESVALELLQRQCAIYLLIIIIITNTINTNLLMTLSYFNNI